MVSAAPPLPLTTFVGRLPEVTILTELITRHRLVTVTGPGGIGKTRLAGQVARRIGDGTFPAGLFWVACGQIADPALVVPTVMAALGLPGRNIPAPAEWVADQLGERRLLIVLDDCDQIAEAAAAFATVLLARCPGVQLLTTSRVRLGVPGEVPWRVPPMAVSDAVALFTARAQAEVGLPVSRPSAPGDAVDPRHGGPAGRDLDEAVAAEICGRLDGLPLAIELAASRTRLLTLPEVARGLDDLLRLLGGGSRYGTARHRTIRVCIDWSVSQLDELARVLLRRLAVFTGGVRIATVEQVCGFGPLRDRAVLDVLTTLVDRSLVAVDWHETGSRFRLLDTVAAYAREQLVAAGELDEVRRRHSQAFVGLVEERHAGLMAGDPTVLAEIDRELDNLYGALAAGVAEVRAAATAAGTVEGEATERMLRLAVALGRYWYRRGRLDVGIHWLRAARRATVGCASPLRVYLLIELASAEFQIGQVDEGIESADAALRGATQAGDRPGRARCLGLVATGRTFVQPTSALPLVAEALKIARVEGNQPILAAALTQGLWAHLSMSDFDQAQARLEELSGPGERLGQMFRAYASAGRGLIAVARGDFPAATQAARQVFAEDLGDLIPRMYGDVIVALTAAAAGKWDEAISRLDARTASLIGAGLRVAPAETMARAAELRAAAGLGDELDPMVSWPRGDPQDVQATPLLRSRALLARARARLAAAPPDVPSASSACSVSSPPSASNGSGLGLSGPDEAAVRADLAAAREIARRNEDQWQLATADELEGRLPRRTGDIAGALAHHHDALVYRVDHRLRPEAATSLAAVAGVEVDRGRHRRAVVLMAAAHHLRDVLGCEPLPVYRTEVADDVATCRRSTSAREFDAAWAEGSELDLAVAARVAGRSRGPRGRPAHGWAALTPAEREVSAAVARGLSNAEVGRDLFMSLSTVKTHLARAFVKLGVSRRAELAALARQGEGEAAAG